MEIIGGCIFRPNFSPMQAVLFPSAVHGAPTEFCTWNSCGDGPGMGCQALVSRPYVVHVKAGNTMLPPLPPTRPNSASARQFTPEMDMTHMTHMTSRGVSCDNCTIMTHSGDLQQLCVENRSQERVPDSNQLQHSLTRWPHQCVGKLGSQCSPAAMASHMGVSENSVPHCTQW